MPKTAKLRSTAQIQLLAAAAARLGYGVLPAPDTLRARGASLERVIASLLTLTLVEQIPATSPDVTWRHGEAGQPCALRLIAAGLAAALGNGKHPAFAPTIPNDPTRAALPAPPPVSALPASPGGKLGTILAALGATSGATITELAGLTGWQPQTTRAALTRLKQRGFPVQLIKSADRKAYQPVHGNGN